MPPAPEGLLRRATEDDAELVLAWFTAFHEEADEQAGREPDPHSGEHNTLDSVLVRIREGVEWVWELPDGEVVHLTGAGLPSYGVSRIGPVFTPKEHRGAGIASYVVGELTRRGLEAGHRMCLFTDQANPTSNKIYARLGYEPVVDMAEHLRHDVRRRRSGAVPDRVCLAVVAPTSAPAAPPSTLARSDVHTVGGCPLFSAENPWNRRIDRRPVWRRSAAIVGGHAAGHDLHLDLGTTEDYYGIPVNVVDEDQPMLPLLFGVDGEDYRDESDRGPVFVPADAAIEGGSASDPDPDEGDRHVLTVRRGTCDLIELYAAERVRNAAGDVVAWRAASAARWDLSSDRLRPAGWTSADAAGLPILPGLLDYAEASSGPITHALRFTLPTSRHAYTWPARHCGPSGNTSATLPTYGMRFRLKSSFPARRYTGVARRIVVAMKRYGLVYADQGSAMFVTGTADPRWSDALDQFRTTPLDGRALEVVKPWRRIVRCQ